MQHPEVSQDEWMRVGTITDIYYSMYNCTILADL